MNRFIVLGLAIVAGVLFGMVLARAQQKRQARLGQTVYGEADKPPLILPWLIGLVVLFVGLFWLASNSERGSIDTRYTPAQLQDGELIPPSFANRTEIPSQSDDENVPIVLPPASPLSLPPAPPLPLPSNLPE